MVGFFWGGLVTTLYNSFSFSSSPFSPSRYSKLLLLLQILQEGMVVAYVRRPALKVIGKKLKGCPVASSSERRLNQWSVIGMTVYSILQPTRLAWIMEGTFPQCKMADNLLLHNGNKVLQIGLTPRKIEKQIMLILVPQSFCFWPPLRSPSPFLTRIRAFISHVVSKSKDSGFRRVWLLCVTKSGPYQLCNQNCVTPSEPQILHL